LPAATFTVSNFIRAPFVSTMNPIQEIALGSCARTWSYVHFDAGRNACATWAACYRSATD